MKKQFLFSFALLSLFSFSHAERSNFQQALYIARFLIMPQDVITKKKIIEWEGWNPVPEVYDHTKYYDDVIKNCNLQERFPVPYKGQLARNGINTSEKFVQSKVLPVSVFSGEISPRQYSIFKYGPVCKLGQMSLPKIHAWPTAGGFMLAKYLLLYLGAKELYGLYKTSAAAQKKYTSSKKGTAPTRPE